jgi:hypothetical protein
MFDFYMKVQGTLGAIELFTLLVGALVSTLYVIGTTPVMLLAAGAIPFTLQAIQVLIVEALNFESLHK